GRHRRGGRCGLLLRLGLRFFRRGWRGSRGRGRCGRSVRTALSFPEVIPFLSGERAGGFGRLIFRAAFLRGQGLRRRRRRERGKRRHGKRAQYFCLKVHRWSPWDIAILKAPILARRQRETTERSTFGRKYRDRKNAPPRIHSPAVQHRSATF